METNMEVSRHHEIEEERGDETVDAEFVETSSIRRQPAGASAAEPTSGPRITMNLDKWLEVDRQLWELYNLCEIAIQQRDDAREDTRHVESLRDLHAARLREWKTYARSLEKRLHAAQIENLEMSFAVKRTTEVAQEAVALSAFSRKRRRELRERLETISEDVES